MSQVLASAFREFNKHDPIGNTRHQEHLILVFGHILEHVLVIICQTLTEVIITDAIQIQDLLTV